MSATKERTRVNFKQIAKNNKYISRCPSCCCLCHSGWLLDLRVLSVLPLCALLGLLSTQYNAPVFAATVQQRVAVGGAACSSGQSSGWALVSGGSKTDSELMLLSRCIPTNTGNKMEASVAVFLVATQKLLRCYSLPAIAETHLADIHRSSTTTIGHHWTARRTHWGRWDGVEYVFVSYSWWWNTEQIYWTVVRRTIKWSGN